MSSPFYLFCVLVKFFRPYRTSKRTLFGEIQRRAERNRRHRRHYIHAMLYKTACTFKFKRTARTLRSFTYVLITPPQLSWLPNPIAILRFFLRKVSLLLCRLQLRCCEYLFPNQMIGLPTLHSCELSVRKNVSLSVEQNTSSYASLWGKQ